MPVLLHSKTCSVFHNVNTFHNMSSHILGPNARKFQCGLRQECPAFSDKYHSRYFGLVCGSPSVKITIIGISNLLSYGVIFILHIYIIYKCGSDGGLDTPGLRHLVSPTVYPNNQASGWRVGE
jgi:hypothetical protein